MPGPHVWLKSAIEDATGYQAWPVEMTGSGAPPYIVYARTQTERDVALSLETSLNEVPPDNLSEATFSVVIYADSYVQAWDIVGDILAAVHNVSGEGASSYIQRSRIVDERDGDAGFLEGREQPTYTVELTVQILYEV